MVVSSGGPLTPAGTKVFDGASKRSPSLKTYKRSKRKNNTRKRVVFSFSIKRVELQTKRKNNTRKRVVFSFSIKRVELQTFHAMSNLIIIFYTVTIIIIKNSIVK